MRKRTSIRETIVAELLLQSLNELGADSVLQVVLLVFVALWDTGVATDWGDVDHAISEAIESVRALLEHVVLHDALHFVMFFSPTQGE